MTDFIRVARAGQVSVEFINTAIDEGRLPTVVAMMHDLSLAMLQIIEVAAATGLTFEEALETDETARAHHRIEELVRESRYNPLLPRMAYFGILEYMERYVPEMSGIIDEYRRSL